MVFNGTHFVSNTGAADNSTNMGQVGDALIPAHQMRRPGAYGSALVGAPVDGGPFEAAPHHVPVGHTGPVAPMHAGMPTGMPYYNAAQHVAAQPFMGYGAIPEQRPAAMAPHMNRMGNGVACNAAPANVNQQLGPVQQVAGQAQVIDSTGDDEPAPAALAATPAPQRAGAKRPSPDSTTGRSAPKAKKPRFEKIVPTDLPSPAAQDMPAALPTPPPEKSHRRKRADPHNLLGSFHKTFVANSVNPQLAKGAKSPAAARSNKVKAQLKASCDNKIDQSAEDPAAKVDSDDMKAQLQASFDHGNDEVADTCILAANDDDDDLEAQLQAAFDLDNGESVENPDCGSDQAPAAENDVTPQASAPADKAVEDNDDDVELAVDENDNIICDNNGAPMLLSRYLAEQAAAAKLEFAFDGNGNHICDGLGMPLTVREIRALQQKELRKTLPRPQRNLGWPKSAPSPYPVAYNPNTANFLFLEES